MDEELTIQFEAMDPEGQDFEFHLLSGSDIYFNSTGFLLWPDNQNDDKDIMIRITDECGNFSDHEIELRVKRPTTTTPEVTTIPTTTSGI